MVLYLVFLALISGVVELQTGNVTDGLYKEEWSKLEGTLGRLHNQTFNISTKDNSTKISHNVTSILYKDEFGELEEKLGLPSNQTLNVITEDNEHFQDQQHYHPHCLEQALVQYSHIICGAQFHKNMMNISAEHWCDMDYIIRPYGDMTVCMESLSELLRCYYPNPNVQDFFLHIHSQYFQNCTAKELLLLDAPQVVVVVLTLIPVSLIPILVFLVVWKSKVRE
ncbi:uncharacterized protein ACJ7VT_005429 [Polymixia lowei]